MSTLVFPPIGVKVPPPPPDVQDFTSSGTWTKPDGAKEVFVECFGGGGSGAVSGSSYASNALQGGLGTAYVARTYDAESLPSTVPVTVGSGGAAVVGTNSSNPLNGNAGGSSAFSPLGGVETSSSGGPGGQGDSNNTYYVYQTRSTGGSGDVVIPGGISGSRGSLQSGLILISAAGLGASSGSGRYNSGPTVGGVGALSLGLLKGGDANTAPGGGGNCATSPVGTSSPGRAGAVRVTTRF